MQVKSHEAPSGNVRRVNMNWLELQIIKHTTETFFQVQIYLSPPI